MGYEQLRGAGPASRLSWWAGEGKGDLKPVGVNPAWLHPNAVAKFQASGRPQVPELARGLVEGIGSLSAESGGNKSPDSEFVDVDEEAVGTHVGDESRVGRGDAKPELRLEKCTDLPALAFAFRHAGSPFSFRNMSSDLPQGGGISYGVSE